MSRGRFASSKMSYVIESTVWPTHPIAEGVKPLIELLFMLSDQNTEVSGPRLASEVFTPTATLIVGNRKLTGTAGKFSPLICLSNLY